MSCIIVFFSNGPLLCVCGKQPIVLATAKVIWGFLWDPFGQELCKMYPFSGTRSFIWWQKMVRWDCLPHYLAISFRSSSYMYIFLKLLLLLWFLILDVSLVISSLIPSSSPLSTWSSYSSPTHHQSIKIIHKIFSFLVHYSTNNLCGSMDCSLLIDLTDTYIWLNMYHISLSGSGVPHSGCFFFLVLFINLWISWFHFLNTWFILHCMNVPRFLYSVY